jgi:hypothetical protein
MGRNPIGVGSTKREVNGMVKRKRNKTAIALLLPMIALVFMLGWIMNCMDGDAKVQKHLEAT